MFQIREEWLTRVAQMEVLHHSDFFKDFLFVMLRDSDSDNLVNTEWKVHIRINRDGGTT